MKGSHVPNNEQTQPVEHYNDPAFQADFVAFIQRCINAGVSVSYPILHKFEDAPKMFSFRVLSIEQTEYNRLDLRLMTYGAVQVPFSTEFHVNFQK